MSDRSNGGWGCLAIIFLAVCLSIFMCQRDASTPRIETRQQIERVFMHTPGGYSVVVNDGGEIKVKTFEWAAPIHGGGKLSVLADVPEGEPMYYTGLQYGEGGGYLEVVIHIHSAKDINGAGWDRGKFGRGQTNVVE